MPCQSMVNVRAMDGYVAVSIPGRKKFSQETAGAGPAAERVFSEAEIRL